MSSPLNTYLAGLALSVSLIIAIGAQNAHVLRQGRREYVFLVAAMCSASDILLITFRTLGFGILIGSFPLVTRFAAWPGAGFLFFYGFSAFRSAREPQSLKVETQPGDQNPGHSLEAVILLTLAVSLLNPHVYLDTIVLIGGIAA